MLLSAGDFVGEESIAAVAGLRMATATAITVCSALKIQGLFPLCAHYPGKR
jgi:hypothetical protein